MKTLAEIVSKIRETAERFHEDYLSDPVEFEGYERIANEFSTLANEIEEAVKREVEAAHKRELSKNMSKNGADFGQLGNGAKMHEALVNISKYADCAAMRQHDATTQHYIEQIRKWAEAALAAPARNCDRYTGKDISRDVADAYVCADNALMLDYDAEELPIRWLLSTPAQVNEYLKHKDEEDKKMWSAIFDRRQQKADA